MTPSAPQSSALSSQNPWPGLRAFTEADCEFFFGRERESEELLSMVRRASVVVLYGQSGLGKTSVIQAGLFPQLKRLNFFPFRLRFNHGSDAPPLAQQLKQALTEALDHNQITGPRPGVNESLWEYFHRCDLDFWGPRNRLLIPVIVLDQFEEVFTLGQRNDATSARVAQFAADLEAVLEHRPPEPVRQRLEAHPDEVKQYDLRREEIRFVVSLREDFLPHLDTWRARMPSLLPNRFRLERMTGAQALDVVQRAGRELVDANVAHDIVDFVSSSQHRQTVHAMERREVEPALLSVVCDELNLRRLERKQSRITADLLSGEREAIIKGFYERAFQGMDPRVRDWVEDELLTASGYRDRAALEDALRLGLSEEAFDRLVTGRILHREERQGVVWLELTHDLLTDPAAESRNQRQQRRQAEVAAEQQKEYVRQLWRTRRLVAIFAVLLVAAILAYFQARRMTVKLGKAQKDADAAAQKATEAAAQAGRSRLTALQSASIASQAQQAAENNLERAQKNFTTALGTTEDLGLATLEDLASDLRVPVHTAVRIIRSTDQSYDKLAKSSDAPATVKLLHGHFLAKAADVLFQTGHIKEGQAYAARAVSLLATLQPQAGTSGDLSHAQSEAFYARGCGYLAMGQLDQAQADFEHAIDLVTSAAQSTPRDKSDMDAVRVRAEIRLGEVEANRLARSAAIAHFERALNFIRDGHLKGPEVESWRAAAIRGEGMSQEDDAKAQALFAQAGTLIHELTDRQPENPRWQGLAAELDYRQGFAFYRLSGNGNSAVSYTLDDAQRLLEQSRKVDQELCDRDPDNLDWCVGLIFASRGLALVHNGLGAPHVSAELEAALNDAKKISSRQPAWLRASLIKILASEDLSDMKAKADSAGALALLTEACQDSRKLVNETSDLLAYRALAACIAQRGEILRTSKKQDEALRSYEQALASLKPIALRIEDDSDFQFDRARYYADIGDAQSELKHAAEAKAAYDTEVSIWAAEVKRNPRPLSYYKLSIADCESGDAYRDDKETAKAINRYDNAAEAIRMAAKAAPTDVNILRQQEFVDGRMSDLWFVQGDLKRSLDMLEKAVEVLWTALRYDPSNETLDKDLTYYRARTDKLDAAVRKDDPSADSEGKQPTKAGDAVLLARIKDLRAKTASQLDSQPSWRVRPLTAGAWRTLPPADPESKLARQHVSQWDPQVKAADILGVRKLVLHFWDDAALYEAEVLLPDGTQGAVDYVQCGDETVLLSGLSQPIHDLNKTHPLKLDTAERAMAYLRFFTGSIQAEDGRFILVDLPEEVRWRTEAAADVQRDTEAKVSPLVVEKTPNGPWQAIGTVQYSDALFVARFRIQRDGDVAMSNDRPVAQDLPVSVDYFHGGIRTTRTLDEARLVIATDQLKADPENEKTLQRLPELQSHLKHWKDAVAAERNWMAFLEKKEKDTPERRAKLLEAYGDLTRYQVRGSDFSGALATAETGLKLDPENEDLVRQLPALHFNLKHWKEAVAAQQNWVSFIERKEKDPAKRRDKLLGAYLNLSWYQLFARDFSGALASSEAGLRLDASDLLLETNHAHALLFLGRTRDAEELYQKYRGHKRSADSSETWEQLINNDFDALEKEGLTPPEEAHIRKLLGTDRITEKK